MRFGGYSILLPVNYNRIYQGGTENEKWKRACNMDSELSEPLSHSRDVWCHVRDKRRKKS